MGHPVHVSSRKNRGRLGTRLHNSSPSGTESTLLLPLAIPGPEALTAVLTAPDSVSIFLYALQNPGERIRNLKFESTFTPRKQHHVSPTDTPPGGDGGSGSCRGAGSDPGPEPATRRERASRGARPRI
ncbi:uncharacterized protein LOC144617138 [Panthera onca]